MSDDMQREDRGFLVPAVPSTDNFENDPQVPLILGCPSLPQGERTPVVRAAAATCHKPVLLLGCRF
jgi:hypothetical protein